MQAMTLSARASRWLLWAVFLVTVPVPFYLGGVELSPALRGLFLAALILGTAAPDTER